MGWWVLEPPPVRKQNRAHGLAASVALKRGKTEGDQAASRGAPTQGRRWARLASIWGIVVEKPVPRRCCSASASRQVLSRSRQRSSFDVGGSSSPAHRRGSQRIHRHLQGLSIIKSGCNPTCSQTWRPGGHAALPRCLSTLALQACRWPVRAGGPCAHPAEALPTSTVSPDPSLPPSEQS